MATYQMLWDCGQCGTAGLLGLDHRFCPTCGAPQDPAARYFPTDAQKVAVADHRFVGADRRCPACDTPNAATAVHCVACGAPMDGAAEVVRRADQVVVGAEAPDSARAARAEHGAARAAAEAARIAAIRGGGATKARARWRWRGPGMLAAGALVAALLVAALCAVSVLWTRPTTLVVTGHRWERSIDVEAIRAVSETAWRDQVPFDARGVLCHQEERSTRQVADGEDCSTVRVDNGDGTFSERQQCTTRYRSEPVYDDRCSYTVDRWVTVRTDRAAGRGFDPPPAWPASSASSAGGERVGARLAAYIVELRDADNQPRSCDLDEARWRSMADGSRWRASVGRLFDDLRCGTLAPEGSEP